MASAKRERRDDIRKNSYNWYNRNCVLVVEYQLSSEEDFEENEMTNSRAKGARGERELAHVLQEYGYDTRRGQQYSGANGDADVVGLPHIHIECKRVEKLNIDKAMQQSMDDARDNEVPVVMHRKDRQRWLVTMTMDEWMRFYERWNSFNAE